MKEFCIQVLRYGEDEWKIIGTPYYDEYVAREICFGFNQYGGRSRYRVISRNVTEWKELKEEK